MVLASPDVIARRTCTHDNCDCVDVCKAGGGWPVPVGWHELPPKDIDLIVQLVVRKRARERAEARR